MAITFRARGRPATVRRRAGDGSHGLLRTIGWSLGLAAAILLLIAPTAADAADPDDGTSLLVGLGGVLNPVIDVTEPVTDVLDPVTEPLVKPIIEPVVEPLSDVLAPVATAVEPVVEPVTTAVVEPVATAVIEPLVEPVAQPASGLLTSVTEPVSQILDPATTLLSSAATSVTPIIEPTTQVLDPVIELAIDDATAEPEAEDAAAPGTAPEPGRSTSGPTADLPVGIDLPWIAPIDPFVPDGAVSDGQRNASALERSVISAADSPTVFDGSNATWAPPWTDPVAVAVSSGERSVTPGTNEIGPLGSFSGLGSGQAVTGLSFGLAVALGLLLLFLLPPPDRVSRLQLAAVFWRPQRFVGPLVPPG